MKRNKIKVLCLMIAMLLVVNVTPVKAQYYITNPKKWSGANSASYAKKYATSYNSNYHEFSSDCTNFASQCVFAGNKGMTGNAKAKKGGEY